MKGLVRTAAAASVSLAALLAAGAAYRLPASGDVYAAVEEDTSFHERLPVPAGDAVALFAERGGDPERHGKRSPLDPLLWRAERPGEPAWEGGPLGRGRPGRYRR